MNVISHGLQSQFQMKKNPKWMVPWSKRQITISGIGRPSLSLMTRANKNQTNDTKTFKHMIQLTFLIRGQNKHNLITHMVVVSKIRKNIYRSDVQCAGYFSALRSLQMFRGPLSEMKHLLNTVLLSGFQNSQWALESTEKGSTWSGGSRVWRA